MERAIGPTARSRPSPTCHASHHAGAAARRGGLPRRAAPLLVYASLGLAAVVGWGDPHAATGAPSAQAPLEGYALVDTWTSRRPDLGAVDYDKPLGIDVADDETIFLVDSTLAKAFHLTHDGRLLADWDARPEGAAPLDVAVLPDPALGQRAFVVSSSGGAVFSSTGAAVGGWSERGLTGVAAGSDRRVYVARSKSGPFGAEAVIDIHDVAGSRLETWDDPGFIIIDPRGLDTSPDGTVFLASGDGTVYAWRSGAVKAQLRLPSSIEGAAIVDVAYDNAGRLFAVQRDQRRPNNARVVAWDVSAADWDRGGAGVAFLASASLPNADGIALGPGGGLVATSSDTRFQGINRLEDRSDIGGAWARWDFTDVELGNLTAPQRLAMASTGDVFITDWIIEATPRRELVQAWSADGRPRGQWSAPGVGDVAGGGAMPCVLQETELACLGAGGATWRSDAPVDGWYAAIDGASDFLAAVDVGRQRLVLFDRDGAEVGGWPLPSASGFAVFSDVAIDGDRIHLADRGARGIATFTRAGVLLGTVEVPGGAVRVAARDGNVYGLSRGGWVYKYDASGGLRAAWRPSPDGSPSDLAVGPSDRVYVADPINARVLVFEPGGPPPGSIPANPDSRCELLLDKRAALPVVERGDEVDIVLDIAGDCPQGDGRFDVVLVLDRSGSMEGGKMVAAKNAVIAFLGELVPGAAQVAMVPFSTSAEILVPLTPDLAQVVRGLRGIEPIGMTNMRPGLEAAIAELSGPAARPEVPRFVVLMSDGNPTDQPQALAAAEAVKDAGFTLYTIGLGTDLDPDILRRMASSPELFYAATSDMDLADVYADIGRRLSVTRLLDSAAVVDELPSDMRYVIGSASPPALWNPASRTLAWDLGEVPPRGTRLTYRVIPTVTGVRPTNVEAALEYTDITGTSDRAPFPVPRITVSERSAWLAYFPFASRNECVRKRADVLLVFDNSSSMNGDAGDGSGRTKMQAALDSARFFLGQMELPDDQAGIVTFDARSRLEQQLTGARGALESALRRITTGSGTRIDAGIDQAFAELLSPRHIAGNSPVMIVLSDGMPAEGTAGAALRSARDARAGGVELFVIGLGSDADLALLSLLAGAHERTFMAPGTSELAAIYEAIAGAVLCR